MALKKFKPEDIRRWKPVRTIENAEREFVGDLDRFLGGNFPSLRFIWNRIQRRRVGVISVRQRFRRQRRTGLLGGLRQQLVRGHATQNRL